MNGDRASRVFRIVILACAPFAACACASSSTGSGTQAPAIDPVATRILKRATDYLDGLKQFSVDAHVTVEDLIETGERTDLDIHTHLTVRRPDKLRLARVGDVLNQVIFYDGKSLTRFNPDDSEYATVAAPPTVDAAARFAGEKLGVHVPAADLIHDDAYAVMSRGTTRAVVLGRAVIQGVVCDHVLFRKPGVCFQLWVAARGDPVPLKYVVTDTGTRALLSTVTVLGNWDVATAVPDSTFEFVPPAGARRTEFLPLDRAGNGTRGR